MAKVHLARIDGAWRVEAIEAIPLAEYANQARALRGEEGRDPYLCAQPSRRRSRRRAKGAKGVRFTPQSDGSGLYCADGAAALGGKIGTLCQRLAAGGRARQADRRARSRKRARTSPSTAGPPLSSAALPPRRKDAATPRRSPSVASASSRMRRQPRRLASSSYRFTLRTMTGVTGSPGQVGTMTRFGDLAPTSRATRRRWLW